MLARIQYWLGPRRPWLWVLLAVLIYTLGGFLLAPWLVERQLVSVSAERAGLITSVDTIDINPYTLTFTMEGLDVSDSEAAPLLSLERLFINFELASLVRRAWSFDEYHVIGLEAALERFGNGDTNVGAVAEQWLATAPPQETAEPEPDPESGQEEDGVVRLVIADLLLDGASLSLVDNVPATPFETRIEALDFSARNLSTLPDEDGSQELTMALDDGAVLTWSGSSSLNPLHSEGRVTLEGPYPALIHEYFRSQLPFDMSGGAVSAGLNYRVTADEGESLSVAATDFQLSVIDTGLSDRGSGEVLATLPEIRLENGELRWPDSAVSLDAVRLRGFTFHPVREEDGSINFVTLADNMTAGQSQSGSGGTGTNTPGAAGEAGSWQVSVGELTLDDWRVLFDDRVPDQDAAMELGLNATLADISNAPEAQMRLDSSVAVGSGGSLSLEGSLVALPDLWFEGQVGLEGLELNVLQPYIEPFARVSVDQGHLAADGALAVSAERQSYRGNVSLESLALTDRNENEPLFRIDSLQLNGVALQQAEETRLDIDTIRLASPYARVEIEEDGSTNIGRVLVSPEPGEVGSESAADAPAARAGGEASPMAIAVDSMVVESARADFADWSLPLPFAVSITELGGDISSLSTRSQQPARIALEGQVGEFGSVTMSGGLRPLAYQEQTQLDLAFRNVDMPSMSPYVIRFAGREIDEGRLDVDLSYRIEGARMSGDNSVVMRDLVLGERVPHPRAADLPLGLAVALLKDRNGVINLDVPVSGDVDNPEFSYGQVVGRAITNILTNIATSPFRVLSGLVGFEGEDLAVIAFAPGRSDVSPPQREKLITLAEALQQRPRLQLLVPPVHARQADEAALSRQLLDQRIEAAVNDGESTGREVSTAVGRRIAVLEEMLVAEGLAVEEVPDAADAASAADGEGPPALSVLRLLHMEPATDTGEARLDEPAYAGTLRDRLLAQQSVPPEALDTLARQRAEQVRAVITDFSAELASQTGPGDATEVSVDDDGRVGMTLAVETAD